MYKKFPPNHHFGCESLYGELAELELKDSNFETAKKVLISSSRREELNNPEVTPTNMLKARKSFEMSLQDYSIKIKNQNVFCTSMETFLSVLFNAGLLEILVNSIESCIEFIKTHLQTITKGSLFHELIYQVLVKLTTKHVESSTMYQPATLSVVLQNALSSFPTSTIFLSLYGWNEGKSKIDNRIRRYINTRLQTNPSHILSLFAAWTEINQRTTPNTQIIRSILKESLFTKPYY
jgi:hypothetical protein